MTRGRKFSTAGFAVTFLLAACTSASDGGSAPVPTTTEERAVPATTSSTPPATARPRPTFPDGWNDIELVASVTEVQPGDEVDVAINCPHRGTTFAAPFRVVHADLTFAMEEVRATEPDVYSTSFVVPYWLEPGALRLEGRCPRPRTGPCDDSLDCEAYLATPTPDVQLSLQAAGTGAWDSWQPSTEPVLSPVVDEVDVGVTRTVDDPLSVSAVCPVDATTDGARFVVLPQTTLAQDRDAWGWTISADSDVPGRYTVSSLDLLLERDRVGGELPWLVEVPAATGATTETGVTISADLNVDGLRPASVGEATIYVTALCEDVGMPFDPGSVDIEKTKFLLVNLRS